MLNIGKKEFRNGQKYTLDCILFNIKIGKVITRENIESLKESWGLK